MSSIRSFIESIFSSNSSNSGGSSKQLDHNGTNSSQQQIQPEQVQQHEEEIATSTYRTYYKSININAYKTSSSLDENSGGGNYYLAGVLFMVSVIGLLLYVNLYYEYCFRDTCYQLSKYRAFFFLRKFFVVAHNPNQNRHHQSAAAQSHIGEERVSLSKTRARNSDKQNEDLNHPHNDDDDDDDEHYVKDEPINDLNIIESQQNNKTTTSKKDENFYKVYI